MMDVSQSLLAISLVQNIGQGSKECKNQKPTGGFNRLTGPPILQDFLETRAVYHVEHGHGE